MVLVFEFKKVQLWKCFSRKVGLSFFTFHLACNFEQGNKHLVSPGKCFVIINIKNNNFMLKDETVLSLHLNIASQ